MDRNAVFLNAIYQNIRMASDSLETLLPKTEQTPLYTEMNQELETYRQLEHKTQELLSAYQTAPQEPGMLNKAAAWTGIQLNSALDTSTSHLADMLIQGSSMGATDLARRVKEFCGCDKPVTALGQEVLTFEQNNIEQLKKYL